MDRGLRLRTAHRRSTRPHHPSCPHPGDERRRLPAQAKPPQKESTPRPLRMPPNAASGEKGLFRYAPEPLLPRNNHILILYQWLPFTSPLWSPFTPPLTSLTEKVNRTPAHTAPSQINGGTRRLSQLRGRYAKTKTVLGGILTVIGFVKSPLLLAVPWGPVVAYGVYTLVCGYAIYSRWRLPGFSSLRGHRSDSRCRLDGRSSHELMFLSWVL
jgi:hypothetical protein